MLVNQWRESLDVVRIDPHARGPKFVQREAHVARVPDHDRIQHKAEGAELVLLPLAIGLAQLSASIWLRSFSFSPFRRHPATPPALDQNPWRRILHHCYSQAHLTGGVHCVRRARRA
jgi:anaerobic glycerol-3-phosphate dehydrogenase